MQTDQHRLEELLRQNTWTPEEKKWLIHYLENTDTSLLRDLMNQWHHMELDSNTPIAQHTSQLMREHISQHTGIDMDVPRTYVPSVHRRFNRAWLAAAACILLVATSIALYRFNNQPVLEQSASKKIPSAVPVYDNDILPGGNRAVLTLADGSSINLDSAGNGSLATQGSTKILKLNSGQLAYQNDNPTESASVFNTLSTPRGGQYQLTLPDGTGVWLNAASAIRFPASFSGNERVIELTGEAYFEVAKSKDKPFKVKLPDGSKVEVFGTHFNICAYKDDSELKATLLEGSISFSDGRHTTLLKPGEQVRLNNQEEMTLVKDVDMDEVIAWKNGLFSFRSTDIKSIMLQLSRWYDVEVSYENQQADERFSASIPRNTPISNVLKLLELTGEVGFKIDGNKITVTR